MSKGKKTITSLTELGKILDKTKLKPAEMVQETSVNQSAPDKKIHEDYERLLNGEQGHNPNPFDFVFFTNRGPKLYSFDDLNKNYGPLKSGYIEVTLKALTPVHIVGKQEPVNNRAGRKISKSYFYIQDGKPCIPGSSIRGMLRSFIEAVTNGWVSQANEEYERGNPTIRHIEFASWAEKEHKHRCLNSPNGVNHTASPAIPVAFKPSLKNDKIDIATYLFGYVDEETKSARAGRVIIEDAYFEGSLLKDYEMVDIDAEAIMGGPRPRANWWYMRPKEVWDRSIRRGSFHVAYFVGDEFWGRKFYYHQDPGQCIRWYNDDRNWSPVYNYKIQCLDKDKSASFRIYFDRVPEKLIQLFCTCLCMPSKSKMRHKLGYGKAFGYGSVEFSITSAKLRTEKSEEFPDQLSPVETNTLIKSWTDDAIKDFIDKPSLNKLAQILTWDNNNTIIFTYPPYNKGNFQTVIQRDGKRKVTNGSLALVPNNKKAVTEDEAITIAKALWDIKKPIHFQLYQSRAKGYNNLKSRKP